MDVGRLGVKKLLMSFVVAFDFWVRCYDLSSSSFPSRLPHSGSLRFPNNDYVLFSSFSSCPLAIIPVIDFFMGGSGTLNSVLIGKTFLNAVDFDSMLQISVNDLPALRTAIASLITLICASVFGVGNLSKCYSDWK